jgi:hypothetical protein
MAAGLLLAGSVASAADVQTFALPEANLNSRISNASSLDQYYAKRSDLEAEAYQVRLMSSIHSPHYKRLLRQLQNVDEMIARLEMPQSRRSVVQTD